jgi:hypothetical protein
MIRAELTPAAQTRAAQHHRLPFEADMLALNMEEAAAVHSDRFGGFDGGVLWVVKVIARRGGRAGRR